MRHLTAALSRRRLLGASVALAAAEIARPVAALAQVSDVIDEGAIEASANVALALDRSRELVESLARVGSADMATRRSLAGSMEGALLAVANAQSGSARMSPSERPFLRLRLPAGTPAAAEACHRFAAFLAGDATVDLAATRRDAAAARRAIAEAEDGRGVTAAVLLTLTFAAEYGSAMRTAADREELRGLREAYRLWADSMRTQNPGAIAAGRSVAEQQHDVQLSALARSPYGERLGIGGFIREELQTENKIADPCVVFNRSTMRVPTDQDGGFRVPPGTRSRPFWQPAYVTSVLLGYSRIKARDNDVFGTRLIDFEPGDGRNLIATEQIGSTPMIGGEYCHAIQSDSVLTPSQAFARAGSLRGYRDDQANRTRIIAAVKTANACRIEISLSGRALAMLDTFGEQLSRLAGGAP